MLQEVDTNNHQWANYFMCAYKVRPSDLLPECPKKKEQYQLMAWRNRCRMR